MSGNFINLSNQILSREIDRLHALWGSYLFGGPMNDLFGQAIHEIVAELLNDAEEVLNYDTGPLDAPGFEAYCIYKCTIINELLFYK